MKQKEKYCGECCWFYAEDTYGYGMCPFQFAEVMQCDRPCSSKDNFVSKEEMERNMELLKKNEAFYRSWFLPLSDQPTGILQPDIRDLIKAHEFAYKYMKVFSEL